MEFQLELALLLAVVVVSLLKSRHGDTFKRFKLPPSPFSLPILGHLHLLGRQPHLSLLHLSRKYGGFMYLKLGTVNTLVVSTATAAREVLKAQDHVFASRPVISSSKYFGYEGAGLAWAPYGEHWRQTRKLCTLELLTAKRVEIFQPVRKLEMVSFLREVLSCALNKTEINLTTKLKDVTFNSMARMVINKSFSAGASSESEREEALFFNYTITKAFVLGGSMHVGDFIPWLWWMDTQVNKIRTLQSHLDEFLQKEVDEHRARLVKDGPKDFMDVMLSTGALSDNSIKCLALDMIAAGTDTAAVTVEWAMAELIKNPKLMVKLQQELEEKVGKERLLEESDCEKIGYLQAVVKETLRLHPPVPLLLPHESVQGCKLESGYELPPKTRLIINAYAIARDPNVWKDPLTFDPERFVSNISVDVRGHNFELLPFGSGRRSCPGMLLGITNVEYILGSLVHGFDWRLTGGKCVGGEFDMSEEFGLTLPRAEPLKLVPSSRLTSKHCLN